MGRREGKVYNFTFVATYTGIGYVTAESEEEAEEKILNMEFDDITHSDMDEITEVEITGADDEEE